MESVYKKGCGPQALGSPNKMISKIAKVASKAKEIDQAYRKEAADAKKDPDYLKFMIDFLIRILFLCTFQKKRFIIFKGFFKGFTRFGDSL